MAKEINDLTQIILDVLAEDKTKYWDGARLVSVVATRASFTNKTRIMVMVKTLISAGKITGRNGRSRPTSIRWKDPSTELDDNAKELVARHEREIAAVREASKVLADELVKAEQALKEAKEARIQDKIVAVHVVKVENGKKKVVKKITDQTYHKKFERILALARARKNIMLYGPTGSGKSHICGQLAAALALEYGFVSCTSGMSEGVLGGRLLPVGQQGTFEYVISEFIKAYENGGVFLLDEIDAADANVLLLVNAALANGKVAVSNRPKKPYAHRHKDFVCIAAANTVGTGADRMYSGRNKLDMSTLDRFLIGKIFIDYDPVVEEKLCPDETLRNRLLKCREAVNAHRLERAVSTRFLRDSYDMMFGKDEAGVAFGWTMDDVEEALFEGWREDEVNKVKDYLRSN